MSDLIHIMINICENASLVESETNMVRETFRDLLCQVEKNVASKNIVEDVGNEYAQKNLINRDGEQPYLGGDNPILNLQCVRKKGVRNKRIKSQMEKKIGKN